MSADVPVLQTARVRPLRRTGFMGRSAVRVAVVLITVLWSLPTVGLLISSFRSNADVRSSGWWEALAHPFETAQWTVNNYVSVLNADGLAGAFVNSLVVTIPSVVIPITMAAFAAYAFAWMRFRGLGRGGHRRGLGVGGARQCWRAPSVWLSSAARPSCPRSPGRWLRCPRHSARPT